MHAKTSGTALGWWVTGLYVLISAVLALIIMTTLSPKVTYGANPPEPTKCASLGIAVSADWWWKTPEQIAESFALARGVGACDVRIGVLWNEIEHSPGNYDWDVLDRLVQGALDAGIEPMLMLYATPEWASTDASALASRPTDPGAGLSASGSGERAGSSVSARVDAAAAGDIDREARYFAEFAGQVAQRYGEHVDGYEIWNEPNTARFFSPPSVDDYLALLKAAYPKIHGADSSATVISAGMAPAPDSGGSISPLSFIRGLYERGGQQYFDAVGIHPYTWSEAPEDRLQFLDIDEVSRIMADHGDADTKIWVTEYGAPTGGMGGITQAEQSDMLQWAVEETDRHPQIEKLYIYALQDYQLGMLDPESHFGIYTSEGKMKVAASDLREKVS